jgi:hypothetical protein
VDEHQRHVLRGDVGVIPQRAAHEVVQAADELGAGEAAAGHDHC